MRLTFSVYALTALIIRDSLTLHIHEVNILFQGKKNVDTPVKLMMMI